MKRTLFLILVGLQISFIYVANVYAADDFVPANDKIELNGQSQISDEDLRKPPYERAQPNWGIHLSGAGKVFKNGNRFPTESSSLTRSVQLSGEWSPLPMETYGVINVGVVASYYAYLQSPEKSTTTKPVGFPGWAVGGLVRYQLKYLNNQWVVPIVGYRYERFSYRTSTNQFESINANGPSFGAWLLLNVIDPSSSASLFTDTGIRRSYLTAEALQLTGSGTELNLAGTTYLFGLRFEM